MKKPNQTTIAASLAYSLLVVSNTSDAIIEERFWDRTELSTIMAGFYALEKTITAKKVKPKNNINIEPIIGKPQFSQEEKCMALDDKEIVEEGKVSGDYRLVAQRDTLLKTSWLDSGLLDDTEKQLIKAGEELCVVSWKFCNPENGHLMICLKSSPKHQYFVFADHFKLYNAANKEIIKDRGKPFKMPGYKSTFYMNDFIAGTHFTWREFWKNGERLPYKKSQVEYAIILAKLLEELRQRLGNCPMVITSAYRPGPGSPQGDVNRKVGGAKDSEHLFENSAAVDFYCPNRTIAEIAPTVEQFCKEKGLSFGDTRLNPSKEFIHIGFRNGWDKVYRRWVY